MLIFESGFDFASWRWEEWLIVGALVFLFLVIILTLFFKPKTEEAPATATVKTRAELEKNAEPEKVEVKAEAQVATPTQEETKKVEEKETPPTADSEQKTRKVRYHIAQNKDKDNENFGKWGVKKERSVKVIKYFKTQKEAIEYAQQLADNQDTSIIIHKRDGSIRKQDYSKK